jgi:hypothetical protein
MGTFGRWLWRVNLNALTIRSYLMVRYNIGDAAWEILTCHINGIFFRFPNTSKSTTTLHIVMKDMSCERKSGRMITEA